jgi:hypothetical protein
MDYIIAKISDVVLPVSRLVYENAEKMLLDSVCVHVVS